MKIPTRITVPVSLAMLCAGGVLVFVWWQLSEATRVRLQPATPSAGTGQVIIPATLSPADARDQALLHLRQGDLLALRGEWAAAEKAYQAAVDAQGGLPALRKLVLAQLQRRDMTGVRASVRALKAAGARPEDTDLIENIVLLRTGEIVQARARLAQATEAPHTHYGLALLSIIEGNHEHARTELQQTIDGWEPVLRANAKVLLGAYEEFVLFPESSNLHLVTLIARALAQVQECELALPLLNQVTREKDDYRDAWIVQGYCELTTERNEQALSSLEHAYNLNPEKPEIQYFLARAYAALGKHDEAVTFLQYALENGFTPKSEVHRLLAREALTKGDAVLALAQFDALTEAEDASLESFEGYVTTALALDQKDQALAKAAAATVKFPEDAHAWELLGLAAAEAGKTDEARTALNKALELDPYRTSAKERLEKLK